MIFFFEKTEFFFGLFSDTTDKFHETKLRFCCRTKKATRRTGGTRSTNPQQAPLQTQYPQESFSNMASETHNSSNSHNNTMGSHFTSLHNISHPNGEEFGTSSPHLPRYKISANPQYSASLIENEIGPPDGKPVCVPSAPVLATKPYSASSTELTNYDKDEIAGKRAQIL